MNFYNLTSMTGPRNCYIRSTDIEQNNWKRLLWSFPDEFLFLFSRGKHVVIIDKSKNKRGGKVERIFVPVMNDLLNLLYFSKAPKHLNLKDHYWRSYDALFSDKSLLTKFRFWENKISEIKLSAKTIHVRKEIHEVV